LLGVLDALRATGAGPEDAEAILEQLAEAFSWAEAAAAWPLFSIGPVSKWAASRTLAMCDRIAGSAPEAANAMYAAWLGRAEEGQASAQDVAGRTWLMRFPGNLRVAGSLRLAQCSNLRSLGAGLRVGGGLDVSRCANLEALPDGLEVDLGLIAPGCLGLRTLPEGLSLRGDLDLSGSGLERLPERLAVLGVVNLRDCLAWDGRIPQGVLAHGRIRTPVHNRWLPLAEWRELHPDGERD
jgi:hypothetical protein